MQVSFGSVKYFEFKVKILKSISENFSEKKVNEMFGWLLFWWFKFEFDENKMRQMVWNEIDDTELLGWWHNEDKQAKWKKNYMNDLHAMAYSVHLRTLGPINLMTIT